MSSHETFTEFWAARCKKNPKLLEKGTIKVSMKVFKWELEKAFMAGTLIPEEMARLSASQKPEPPENKILRNIHKLLGVRNDEASMVRAGKTHNILDHFGIRPEVIFESKTFAESIIAYIVGDISEEIFTNVCKAEKQGLS